MPSNTPEFPEFEAQMNNLAIPVVEQPAAAAMTTTHDRRQVPKVYYAHLDNRFWAANSHGGYIQLDQSGVKRLLKAHGISSRQPEGGGPSQMDMWLLKIQKSNDIQYAGPLAGYRKGDHVIANSAVLVTESPKLIEPVEGDWSTLKKFIDGLLVTDEFDQTQHLYGWLKSGYEPLRGQQIRPGQALVIAGKAGAGKSLLQNLITEILGGRSAKPYQFMTGLTAFNSDLFRAEHLIVEDEASSTDMRFRRHFGAMIKNITVNETQQCHPKHRVPITLTPFWRISITVNEEAEHLMVLPPIDASLEDKLILLRARAVPMPMPTTTLRDRAVFRATLSAELPAFLAFLLQWQIPASIACPRFGVRAFHHPELLAAIDELSPELRLLNLVDAMIFKTPPYDDDWEGLATDMENRLLDNKSGLAIQARSLLSWHGACGAYLKRLAVKMPDRVSKRRIKGRALWRITPPPVAIERRPIPLVQAADDY